MPEDGKQPPSIELQDLPAMDRIRHALYTRTKSTQDLSRVDRLRNLFYTEPETNYEPIENEGAAGEETMVEEDVPSDDTSVYGPEEAPPFSWVNYMIFLILGIAMLWAWNMFLAAAPYFHTRFESNAWIVKHFQSAEISVSTFTNLGTMITLATMQKNASYPRRIIAALFIYTVCFTALALSTLTKMSAGVYFGFLMAAILAASFSTGLIQNGMFAFTSGFGRSEYTQAIMTGQAVAGVLPPLAQIVSVLAVPAKDIGDDQAPVESPKSAFIYFMTATGVSGLALLSFFFLLSRGSLKKPLTAEAGAKTTSNTASEGDALTGGATMRQTGHDKVPGEAARSIPLTTLFLKLPFLSAAVFICFAVTMVFPVFTSSIVSVGTIKPEVFIPLAYLMWNLGDLLGRLSTLWPKISLTHYPFALFCLAMARLIFIPMYFLCNVGDRGAAIKSDYFYLLVVQILFGFSNGYLGSECMMGAGDWVAEDEREAAGGYMGLMLVGGLTVGSLLSFTLGSV